MHMVAHPTATAQQHHLPTAAEIIIEELSRVAEDERMLQRIVGLCTILQRHGRFDTTQEAALMTTPRLERELALVRAAKCHLQHQARTEGLALCALCGLPTCVCGASEGRD